MDFREGSSKYDLEGKIEERMDEMEKMTPIDANKDEINGEMGFEDNCNPNLTPNFPIEPIGYPSLEPKVKGDGIGDRHEREPTPNSTGSSSNSNLEVNSTPTKGYGLKKWRRIRRTLNKDASSGVDVSPLILKKKHSLKELLKAQEDCTVKNVVEEELETPTPSVRSFHLTGAADAVALDPELVKLVASGGFSIGVDSDNSEDRSYKSSMVASVPTTRHGIGFGRERGRLKNIGGRGIGNAMQQIAQRGRGSGVDASKKIRGDRVWSEKENSQSSVESDLRSSNAGFMMWGSGVSKGKPSEKSLNFDGENGDGAQTCEEIRPGYYKENGTYKELLREDFDPDLLEVNKVKRENSQPPSGIDPLAESVVRLQAVQEALEIEIQKFGELGKISDRGESEAEVSGSPTLEAHSLELNQKIDNLQYELDQTLATVKAKESKVLELEVIVKNLPILDDMHRFELELENLHKEKIQAEVEFLVIARTVQSWKILAEDQTSVLEEQAEMMLKMRDAEEKAFKLKQQAEKLASKCEELLQTERVLEMQKEVAKISLCCFIQLLLLCVAFGLFLIKLPTSDEFVPT